jgi:hypothetical protein
MTASREEIEANQEEMTARIKAKIEAEIKANREDMKSEK